MKFASKPKYIEAFFIHGKDVTPRWDYSHHLMPPMTSSVTFRLESAERGAEGFCQFAISMDCPTSQSISMNAWAIQQPAC